MRGDWMTQLAQTYTRSIVTLDHADKKRNFQTKRRKNRAEPQKRSARSCQTVAYSPRSCCRQDWQTGMSLKLMTLSVSPQNTQDV